MANIQPRYNKDGKIISYSIRVFKGRDANGKQLKPYSMTFEIPEKWSEEKAKKEAEKAAIVFEKECKEGIVADNKQTFARYAKYVIDLKENVEKRKHRTIKYYREMLERINPAIGHFKLSQIKPQHLNAFYEQLSQKGMHLKTQGYLSPETILKHHKLIHLILKQATKELLIPFNPASLATIPSSKKKEANYLEEETIKDIMHYLEFEPLKWQVAIYLLIFSGGRRGEVVGLKEENIYIKRNVVKFINNILYSKEKGVYSDTLKTETSKREVEISEYVMQKKIKPLLKENKKNMLRLGSAWNNTGYLLTQENGLPMHPDSLTKYCYYFRKKYNEIIEKENKNLQKSKQKKLLPHINPHAFRHSHVSILVANNIDIVKISRRLGHARPSTTSDIYSHLLKNADSVTANTFNNIMLPNGHIV